MAVTLNGEKVYVANTNISTGIGTVSVIAAPSNKVVDTVTVGSSPIGVAVTPDGSRVYVVNDGDSTVSVISTATDAVIGSPITVGAFLAALGVFIQPAIKFAGTPGKANCYGQSVSALAKQYRGVNSAGAALGFSGVQALEEVIMAFCGT